MNLSRRDIGTLLIIASVIMGFFSGVLMMSEGIRPDGGIGWQPVQTLAIWGLAGFAVLAFCVGLSFIQSKDQGK